MNSTLPSYPADLTVREARQRYFDANGFINGGYDDKWVRLKAGPFRFAFPNVAARKRSVRLHDVHHIATGFDTTWTGEAEIGAWELVAGCGRHWVAWVLNAGAAALGLFFAPAKVWRAFMLGRRTDTLYGAVFEESILDESVGGLRHRLGLDLTS